MFQVSLWGIVLFNFIWGIIVIGKREFVFAQSHGADCRLCIEMSCFLLSCLHLFVYLLKSLCNFISFILKLHNGLNIVLINEIVKFFSFILRNDIHIKYINGVWN